MNLREKNLRENSGKLTEADALYILIVDLSKLGISSYAFLLFGMSLINLFN